MSDAEYWAKVDAEQEAARKLDRNEVGVDGTRWREIRWDIRREGRPWTSEEVNEKYFRGPDKMELIGGRLFWTHADRMYMIGLLLENVGIDAVLELGDLETWKAAMASRELRE